MSTTLATRESTNSIKALIQRTDVKEQLAQALPKYYSADQFAVIVRTAINKNPKLMECTPESFMIAVLTAAQMGIAPNGRDGHLIPRWNSKLNANECQFQADYKGLVGLVRKNDTVKDIYAVVVKEGEPFSISQGLHRDLQHSPDPFSFRPLVGAYAVIVYPDGSTGFEWMNRHEIEAVREKSDSWKSHVAKGYSTPWKTDEGEMWKKTVLKRLLKLADLSPDTAERVAIDVETTVLGNGNGSGKPRSERPALPEMPAEPPVTQERGAELAREMKQAVEKVAEPPPAQQEPAPKQRRAVKLASGVTVEPPAKGEDAPTPPADKKDVPKPAEDAPLPGGEPEPPARAAEAPAASEKPIDKLRAECAGFTDAEILGALKAYNLASPGMLHLTDVPPFKLERALEDPESIRGELAQLRKG